MQQIAVIRILLDPVTSGETSTTYHRDSEREWQVVLRPQGDKNYSPKYGKDTASILAHELGHAVSAIMGLQPPHINNSGSELAEEKRAWMLAEEINPKLDKNLEAYAIRTYASQVDPELADV